MRPTSRLLSLARNGSTPAQNAAEITSRTVHVKSYPSARTLAERREVLRVLEGFGEVTMFRSLRHHPLEPVPNAFFAIFASAASVTEIVNASPIRYRLTSGPVNPATNTSTSSPDASATSPNTSEDDSSSSSQSDPQPTEQIFSLTLNTTTYSHEDYLTSLQTNPLYYPYRPVSPLRSLIAGHLTKTLPIKMGMGRAGLCDWESGDMLGRRRRLAMEDDEDGGEEGNGAAAENMNVPWRIFKKDLERMKEKKRVTGGLKRFLRGDAGMGGKF
ncbi:hypothetical protein ACMFMG_011875 [Clarireedia jacksonii]